MRILALDIGSGTEDILLYDGSKEIENCIKIVLPSPSLVYSRKIRYFTKLRSDLFIKGGPIGGGRFTESLRRHLKTGSKIIMTKDAAYSVRNNLEEVRARDIQVIEGENPPQDFKGETLEIKEVNITELEDFLSQFEEDVSDVDAAAIAVQDHGIPKDKQSNRRFRIEEMRKKLSDNPELESLAYRADEIPTHFIRMKAAAKAISSQIPAAQPIVMDTSAAAILGCLEDPKVKRSGTVLTANIGNEHVTASIISRGRVLALLEHHTELLIPEELGSLLKAFTKGKVKGDSVFDEGGHGAFYLRDPAKIPRVDTLTVTGPNRIRLQKTRLKIHLAAPGGDMMMTGPIGLVKATKAKLTKS